MNIGHLLFKTHGELQRKQWWFAQIFVWGLSYITLHLYLAYSFHVAIFTSIIWVVFFWWKTNINIKRLHNRHIGGWGVFWRLVWFEVPVIGWLHGFIVMGILGEKNDNKEEKSHSEDNI